jgi:hypothetical protein
MPIRVQPESRKGKLQGKTTWAEAAGNHKNNSPLLFLAKMLTVTENEQFLSLHELATPRAPSIHRREGRRWAVRMHGSRVARVASAYRQSL